MADVDELAGLLTSARQGDQDALLRAQEQLSPFVHALIICRAPHHLAGNLVRHAMVQAAMKLDTLTDPREFIRAAFEVARHLGDASPGAEDLATEPLLADGRKLLQKLRALQMPLRERLMMRLLEGLTGPELADLLQLNEEEVRHSLDQALSEHLQQPAGAFKANGYLWSMVGNPPDALVKLENLLTPLRFDPSLLSAGDESTDVTPVNPVKAVKRPGEGRKPTGESQLAVPPPVASPGHGALKQPSGSHLRPSSSSPRHPPGSGNSGTHVRTSPSPSPHPSLEGTDPTGAPLTATHVLPEAERTDATATSLPPVLGSPVLVAVAPNIGAPQSSGTVARTIQASDLPAAGAFDLSLPPRLSPPVLTREAPPEIDQPQSDLSPLPPVWSNSPKPDDESTQVQPTKVPLVTAPVKAARPAADPETTAAHPNVIVRRSQLGERPAPPELFDDPHLTRAILPPVDSFAPRGSVFSSYRPFVVAAAFGLVAIGVVALMLSGVENRVKKGWNLVPVVVAAADLPEGTTIGLESISQRSVPEQFVTSSVVRPDNTDYVINQRLLVPVQAGDPLLWTQFEASRAGERLSRKIQKKARAVAIRASATTAVGGWVQPNDRIDIIASFSKPNSQERAAVTLLNDIPVISAGKVTASTFNASREREKAYQDVTVLVLPEEAEIITLAARLARLKFTLRAEDQEREEAQDARYHTEISTLLNGEKVQVIQKKRWELLKNIRAAKKARDL